MKRLIIYRLIALLFITTSALPVFAQKADTLTLRQAFEITLKNNRLLKISGYKVDQNTYKWRQMKSHYLPRITSKGRYGYSNNVPLLSVDKGSFGILPGQRPIPLPPQNFTVLKGNHETYSASVTFYQPLSQLVKIHPAVHAVGEDVSISKNKLKKNRLKILFNVRKLYYGLLHEQAELAEKKADVNLAKAKLRDARVAQKAGKTLKVSVVGLQADILDKKHDVITCQNKIDDYWYDLKDLMGVDPNKKWKLEPVDSVSKAMSFTENKIINQSAKNNPDLMISSEQLKKAGYGIEANRRRYLPDIGAFAQYKIQRGIPITPKKMGIVGVSLKWNLFTFGQRSNEVKASEAQMEQAQLALTERRKKIRGEIEKEYRKFQRSRLLIKTAKEAMRLRREQLRLAGNKHETGLGLSTVVLKAKYKLAKTKSDYIGAVVQFKLSKAKLLQLAGRSN